MADDSHKISYLIFFRKLGKMSQNLSSAALVIGALRVNNGILIQKYIYGAEKSLHIWSFTSYYVDLVKPLHCTLSH